MGVYSNNNCRNGAAQQSSPAVPPSCLRMEALQDVVTAPSVDLSRCFVAPSLFPHPHPPLLTLSAARCRLTVFQTTCLVTSGELHVKCELRTSDLSHLLPKISQDFSVCPFFLSICTNQYLLHREHV